MGSTASGRSNSTWASSCGQKELEAVGLVKARKCESLFHLENKKKRSSGPSLCTYSSACSNSHKFNTQDCHWPLTPLSLPNQWQSLAWSWRRSKPQIEERKEGESGNGNVQHDVGEMPLRSLWTFFLIAKYINFYGTRVRSACVGLNSLYTQVTHTDESWLKDTQLSNWLSGPEPHCWCSKKWPICQRHRRWHRKRGSEQVIKQSFWQGLVLPRLGSAGFE